jgi:hypothetical protein
MNKRNKAKCIKLLQLHNALDNLITLSKELRLPWYARRAKDLKWHTEQDMLDLGMTPVMGKINHTKCTTCYHLGMCNIQKHRKPEDMCKHHADQW